MYLFVTPDMFENTFEYSITCGAICLFAFYQFFFPKDEMPQYTCNQNIALSICSQKSQMSGCIDRNNYFILTSPELPLEHKSAREQLQQIYLFVALKHHHFLNGTVRISMKIFCLMYVFISKCWQSELRTACKR